MQTMFSTGSSSASSGSRVSPRSGTSSVKTPLVASPARIGPQRPEDPSVVCRFRESGNGVESRSRVTLLENGYTPTLVDAATGKTTKYTPEQVFTCPEESLFYSQCLQRVLEGGLNTSDANDTPLVVEFGAGDGSPVIDALLKAGPRFDGMVHGFELNPRSANLASTRCDQLGLNGQYKVHQSCFFKGAKELLPQASWLVANPPYIPAPDNNILMPELHGGIDGATLTNELLSLGFPNAMLLVSSYSNPLSTLRLAKKMGYSVTDFMITPLPFGTYSSEPKVRGWIRWMQHRGEAFSTEDSYLLAGVVFQRNTQQPDVSPVLSSVLAALK